MRAGFTPQEEQAVYVSAGSAVRDETAEGKEDWVHRYVLRVTVPNSCLCVAPTRGALCPATHSGLIRRRRSPPPRTRTHTKQYVSSVPRCPGLDSSAAGKQRT